MKEGRISNMGIFSHANTSNQRYTIDDLNEDVDIIPCNSLYGSNNVDYIEESNNIILDTYDDWCNMTKEVWIREAKLYREDEYYAITENFIEDLIMGIKKFLVKLWRAIAGMFKSFSMMLDKYMLNDKSFLNKYRQKLLSKTLDSEFSFSGFVFTIDENEVKNAIQVIMQDPENVGSNTITQTSQSQYYGQGKMADPTKSYLDVDDKIEKLRNHVLQKFSKCPNKDPNRKVGAKDFTEEINASLRNGQDSTEEIDNKIDVQAIVNELENSQNTRKIMNTALREGKKAIDIAQKETDARLVGFSRIPVTNPQSYGDDKERKGKQQRTNQDFRSDQMKELSYFGKYIQQSRTVLVALEGCILKALKDRSRQNKNAVIEILQYKSSSSTESVQEHYSLLDDPFKGINLI